MQNDTRRLLLPWVSISDLSLDIFAIEDANTAIDIIHHNRAERGMEKFTYGIFTDGFKLVFRHINEENMVWHPNLGILLPLTIRR
jgi:hypothetical protein